MIWTVMMQSAKDVQASKVTTRNAILKRRLADRNLSRIRSNMLFNKLERR
jgi:hypothetical protein